VLEANPVFVKDHLTLLRFSRQSEPHSLKFESTPCISKVSRTLHRLYSTKMADANVPPIFKDPEVLEAEQVVPMGTSPDSSSPQIMPSSEVRRHTNAWTVQMHFARAQTLHMAEAMRDDPTLGFINPRIRPDLDPSHPSYTGLTIGPQPRTLGNSSLGGFDNYQDSNQYAGEALEDERNINEVRVGDLLDDMINDEEHNENGGMAEKIDFSGPEHDGFNVEFEGFTNNGRFTLVNASLEHPCVEIRANGHECSNPCTFPCQGDHSHMAHNPHHVCHDCRVQGDLTDVNEEKDMIAKHRIYFCAECTTKRATGPAMQMWTHPRRFAEIKTRKVNKCSCHDALQKGWICGYHRDIKAEEIERWGPEKLKSFRNFFGGNFCADCRINPPESDGDVVMWQCAMCDDFVLKE